ncbi:UDP-N-acetylglucosamine 2-epimerase (hydrolyzing) [bacterium D16-51]|nr:UDP-N-acetylglucosamine 2-epimerase (hydrolyzing) [bacterium D16-59]RKI55888.1 UDP-N-acetylglucosamine 2-epimerase (hydrolyzing) [bacterium D16-51]
MKSIAIVTATRAEYGLLKPVITKLIKRDNIEVRVVVTGAHLVSEFGYTVQEIRKDNIPIDKEIEILLSSDTPVAVSKSMGLAIISFAEYFHEKRPDAVMVLGDRYEMLAICCAAMNERIPIMHLHGGETTEGLIDEAVRHAITKMSYLHFTSTESYRRRVIQLGEVPEHVFNVGALGVENALSESLLSKADLEESLGIVLGRFAIGTYHPVTLEDNTEKKQVDDLLQAIDNFQDITFLFTKANADSNGRIINEILRKYEEKHSNFYLVDSLGMKRYLSALKYAEFVIGNSSSGLIETPSFHVPTINIGDRQKGRISGDTVINCTPKAEEIVEAIKIAVSPKFKDKIKDAKNPYGDGNTSEKVVAVTEKYLMDDEMNIKKKFNDLNF